MLKGELWWANVPNASGYIRAIAENAGKLKNIMYCIGSDIMWHDVMTEKIDNALEDIRDLYEVNMTDETKSPGEILFCKVKPELKCEYRSSLGYEDFFAKYANRTVLIDKYIVIRNCDSEQIEEWCSFISEYCTKAKELKKESLVFVIENTTDNTKKFPYILNMDINEHIRYSDTKIMCTLAASKIGKDITDTMKEYISELAFSFGRGDVELAAELIGYGEKLAENPEAVLSEVLGLKLKSSGQPFKSPENITKLIWRSQLGVYFPIIERSRLDIIDKNSFELENLSSVKDIFGNVAETIYDIELGTLKNLCDREKISISKSDLKRIKFLRDCRNTLAHCNVMSYSDLKKISSKY